MSKGQIILYSLLSVCGISFIIALVALFTSDSSDESFSEIPRMEQDEEFTVEDMTTFVSDDYMTEDDIQTDDKMNITELLKKRLQEKNRGNESEIDTIATTANDSLLQEILEEQEAQDRKAALSYSESKLTKEEKEREYLQWLIKERAAYDKKNEISSTTNEVITVEASIYNDQRVMPNDRVKLILDKDAKILGKKYKRGTTILAYIIINESRIFLDIENIQGHSMSIKAFDSYDYREGIYSQRAAELWEDYKNEQSENGNNEVSSAVSRATSSTIAGGVIQDIGAFFRKKRIKEKKKILLVNGHSVLLKIRPNITK